MCFFRVFWQHGQGNFCIQTAKDRKPPIRGRLPIPVTYTSYLYQLSIPVIYTSCLYQLSIPVTYTGYLYQLCIPVVYTSYLGVSWCCGNYCWLSIVLWCGYCLVPFESFVLRHLVIATSATPRNYQLFIPVIYTSYLYQLSILVTYTGYLYQLSIPVKYTG